MDGARAHTAGAADGTRLAWYLHGAPGAGAPVVLTNGLSTSENFWMHVVAALAPRLPVVHWHYRGHGASGAAGAAGYTIETHSRDLEAVVRAAQAATAAARAPVHVAFSMGVIVLLELYRRRPDLVGAMVLIAGGADHPYATSRAFRVPGARRAVRAALAAAAPLVPRLSPVLRRASESRALFPLARATGAIGRGAPRAEVERFFRTVGAMDHRAYWETLRSLMDARASDVLPSVRVPVLIVAPERDVMALRGDLEALRRGIPDAEWWLVPGTGHAVLLEEGPLVAERVRAFVERVVAAPALTP
jgi:pimeloyl-ACP methyl ester carboxylesterase